MNLQHRIYLLSRLGDYILADGPDWRQVVERAGAENGWFIPEFVDSAAKNIAKSFLNPQKLASWADENHVPDFRTAPKNVGIIMAGNIPLVGFHDWLAVFLSGHNAVIKPSSRDQVLIKHLTALISDWDKEAGARTVYADMLKGLDAYIATGSNNSSRYFDYYFSRYPHIIRKNRTSVAILDGTETTAELEALADDVYLYFGLGCRNVTKIFVPEAYDFVPLLEAFRKYNYLADHHKYKNNFDYNLALHLLNKQFYMTNGSLLLVESPSVFSPISQLNYSFYSNKEAVENSLQQTDEIQAISGHGYIPFGQNQCPAVSDFADAVNTLDFLNSL
ncbi:MAG: acyl-CoA reductase [Chitinophagales bacterium]|nr:acyl-CoA reductase [Chitinophagales bacterium]